MASVLIIPAALAALYELSNRKLFDNKIINTSTERQDNTLVYKNAVHNAHLPLIYGDDRREQARVGDNQRAVRAPFGASYHQPEILSQYHLFNQRYNNDYSRNIYNLRIRTQGEWRLDPNLNSTRNLYSTAHIYHP